MKSIRVLIVDDHPVVRKGLRGILQGEQAIEVLDKDAENGEEAIQLVTTLKPDVILMDLEMPDGQISGLQAIRRIRQAHPDQCIVVLTHHSESLLFTQALKLGVSYILKDADDDEIITAILGAYAGNLVVSPSVIRESPKDGELSKQDIENVAMLVDLTAAELAVLQLIMQGDSNEEIRRKLVLSPHTVKNHITSINRAFGVEAKDATARQELKKKVRERAGSLY